MTAPTRQIIASRHIGYRHTNYGKLAKSTLECGHITDTNARDRKIGHIACFDCLYSKPIPTSGATDADTYFAIQSPHPNCERK